MNSAESISLPAPIGQYIDSANRFDAAAAAGFFTADAMVRDEQKERVGRAAIERWVVETSKAYQPRVTVTSARAEGATVYVGVTVAGNFDGSPISLDYEFHLRDGLIAQLTIG